jgi:hypothetical protein
MSQRARPGVYVADLLRGAVVDIAQDRSRLDFLLSAG